MTVFKRLCWYLLVLVPHRAGAALVDPAELPLRTEGRFIVGQSGNRVKLSCVNWAGGEEKDGIPGGLHFRPAGEIAATIREMGFNCVRLLYSVYMVKVNPVPKVQWKEPLLEANPELYNSTALQIFDVVVEALASEGLMIILDNHMSDGDWCCEGLDHNGLWYNGRYPEAAWIDSLTTMAERYKEQPFVVGHDLRNEVRASQVDGLWISPNWGWGGPWDWLAAAQRAGNAIHAICSDVLIIIGGTNWEKDLTGVYLRPAQLKQPNRVVYSAHVYPWTYPGSDYEILSSQWHTDFGYIFEGDTKYTAPVWISEFGTSSKCAKDACDPWWPVLMRYLAEHDLDWAYWQVDGTYSRNNVTWRPLNSPTDYGVLSADWETPAHGGELLAQLQTLQPARLGPGATSCSFSCERACDDHWNPGWINFQTDRVACSSCLRDEKCRQGLSAQEWCGKSNVTQVCGRTCCMAFGITPEQCPGSDCLSTGLKDHWTPLWPNELTDSHACRWCAADGACRLGQTVEQWCATDAAQEHCPLTCCRWSKMLNFDLPDVSFHV